MKTSSQFHIQSSEWKKNFVRPAKDLSKSSKVKMKVKVCLVTCAGPLQQAVDLVFP